MRHEQDRGLVAVEQCPKASRIAPDDREAALASVRCCGRRGSRRRPRAVRLERPAFEAAVVRIVEVGQDQPLDVSFAEREFCRLPHALEAARHAEIDRLAGEDRKSTRLNSSHGYISYAVFCLKKKKKFILLGSISIEPNTQRALNVSVSTRP